jgi:hypothetical protein
MVVTSKATMKQANIRFNYDDYLQLPTINATKYSMESFAWFQPRVSGISEYSEISWASCPIVLGCNISGKFWVRRAT